MAHYNKRYGRLYDIFQSGPECCQSRTFLKLEQLGMPSQYLAEIFLYVESALINLSVSIAMTIQVSL